MIDLTNDNRHYFSFCKNVCLFNNLKMWPFHKRKEKKINQKKNPRITLERRKRKGKNGGEIKRNRKRPDNSENGGSGRNGTKNHKNTNVYFRTFVFLSELTEY